MSLKKLPLNTSGQKYHDFVVTKAIEIPEMHCVLRELTHLPTDARIMHIANDDTENLFCLSFQTLPTTSNGVAHVLEHTVLCGSKKYPIKDPFFAMSRRSLNTYMNALTGADFTCYPAASQVPKDFYNLLEVYLDAVFHPNLDVRSFLQEGHRLEFATPSDTTTPLEYKGVVFNEMKGGMASGSARLTEAMNAALFPDLTYGINSGGDPQVIPKLTYEELCEFHRQYYHPSRCLFFFNGNIPLEQHLDFLETHAFQGVAKAAPLPPIPRQPRFKEPKRLRLSYPISPEEDLKEKTMISFGWLTCDILSQQELLAMTTLDIILMENDASQLKMALMKSGYCTQVSAYLDIEIVEIPFIIILRGCNPDKAPLIEELIIQTLKNIVQKGIPLQEIEDAIHQQEIHRSEITGDSAPFGLSLFFRSGLRTQHGAEPESGLKTHSLFDALRKKNLEDPRYFTQLIQKHLIDNPHFVRIVMTPDREMGTQEIEEERTQLAKIRAGLTEKQEKEIVANAAELKKFQKKQEKQDPNILPRVTLHDVPKIARDYSLRQERVGPLNVFHHAAFTNGIVYADLVFDVPAVAEEDLVTLRLMSSLVSQLGCGGRSYSENLEYCHAHTGGVSATLGMDLLASDFRCYTPSMGIRGRALHRKAEKFFTIMRDMMITTDFTDIPRIKEVILKQYTSLQSTINQNALRYAINLSSSQLDRPSKISNIWSGLDYFKTIRDLAQNFDSRAKGLVQKLQKLQADILLPEHLDLVITCDAAMYDELKRHGFYGLQSLDSQPHTPWKDAFDLQKIGPQGRLIASPIAFTSKVFKTVPYVHADAPALNAAAFIFDNVTLHTRLREQGGAYGGGAVSNAMSGSFYFYSFRDPNVSSSLKAFEESVQIVVDGKFDESDLEEAKLEIVQSLDTPYSPGSRADRAYGWLKEGRTHNVRQAFRNRLLSITKQDVIDAVVRHVVPNMKESATVVFAGKELLEKENALLIKQGHLPLNIETV